MTTGVVGNSATRMKPVPNTPTSDPAVPSASTRPTTRPVCSTSRSCALTVNGLTALSNAAGAKNATAARNTIVTGLDASVPGPTTRMIGTAAIAAAPPSVSAIGSSARGSKRSARRPPHHVPGGDAGEDDADHAGERLQRHPDVGRQQAPGERLQDEDAPGRHEHERSCVAGLHGRGPYRRPPARRCGEQVAASPRRMLDAPDPGVAPPARSTLTGPAGQDAADRSVPATGDVDVSRWRRRRPGSPAGRAATSGTRRCPGRRRAASSAGRSRSRRPARRSPPSCP